MGFSALRSPVAPAARVRCSPNRGPHAQFPERAGGAGGVRQKRNSFPTRWHGARAGATREIQLFPTLCARTRFSLFTFPSTTPLFWGRVSPATTAALSNSTANLPRPPSSSCWPLVPNHRRRSAVTHATQKVRRGRSADEESSAYTL